MRSTGDGTGSPARLPSKRVKRSLRRAAITSAPSGGAGVVGGGEVAAGGRAAPAAGAPARWPGTSRCRSPASKDATCRTHGSRAAARSGAHHAPRRRGGVQRSSTQRDGTRSTLRRRSPRGTQSSCRRAPASAARSWWCWRSTRSARRASSPPVRARSWSGRRESSRTVAGKEPSARPRTTTRSRSSPMPISTEPTSTPSPKRPDPAEVLLELELEGAVEHVEGDRRPRRRRGRRGGGAPRRPARRPCARPGRPSRSRRPSPPRRRPSQRCAQRGVLAPAARAGGRGA